MTAPAAEAIHEGIVTEEAQQARCGCCGATFRQVRITGRFILAAARAALREGLEEPSIVRTLPDGWVPTMCVPCERYDLRATAHEGFVLDDRFDGCTRRLDIHRRDRRVCCDGRRRAQTARVTRPMFGERE